MNSREQSFTLMELMIVVMVIGIIAGFAIPSYQKALDKADERNAVVRLQAIRAGMKIYKARHNSYPAFDMPDVASINQNLGLNIIANTMSYQCFQTDGLDDNICKAISPDGWIIHWHDPSGAGDILHCFGGTGIPCPTCKGSGAGGCG